MGKLLNSNNFPVREALWYFHQFYFPEVDDVYNIYEFAVYPSFWFQATLTISTYEPNHKLQERTKSLFCNLQPAGLVKLKAFILYGNGQLVPNP